jgi:2-C-methyl-D-erythritol 4-phosphate cytidylyltransferase
VSVAAIIVAGGRGERFGGLKQFAEVNGRSVAAYSVAHARAVATSVVLVVPDGYRGDGEGADVVVMGGATRSESVRAGLVSIDADIVVVHDAARPLATPALFRAVVDAVVQGAAAAVPGLSVTDTVKRVERADVTRVVETIARENLVTVQTPQAFRTDLLRAAHATGQDATDDAALIESHGELVVVVPGESTNIKVTEPDDLDHLASMIGSA